ncbi:hypothetical protein CTAYLR_004188 [Chrysophaeum taylorii]|uniref:Uncharacterized protein n=1 Tax=Chrysophaeum taylorii TaxID=2483200 RepID=A0AAD7UII9_9STRA|nr:hypothetical protein CTAYLR_004188 [Chrysophaeum taylorii]
MFGLLLIASSSVVSQPIALYTPATNVVNHSLIDLDVEVFAERIEAGDYAGGLLVYETGGNSVSSSGSVRTLQGFTTAGDRMANHTRYPTYRNFWEDDDYANTYVIDAISGVWADRSDPLRAELAIKGVQYQVMWMYMLHEFEDALILCEEGSIAVSDASDSAPHRWDEGWAFYAGSLEGTDGTGDGVLLHNLAEIRCVQFGTCTSTAGAIANEEALLAAETGLAHIIAGNCTAARAMYDDIFVAATIPILQGTLKYVYDADPVVNGGNCTGTACTYDEAWAEGWAFAAAILPLINACDPSVATVVRANLDVDNDVPMPDGYVAVKAQIESTYACLGLTCADVGAYQTISGVYPGMEACTDDAS